MTENLNISVDDWIKEAVQKDADIKTSAKGRTVTISEVVSEILAKHYANKEPEGPTDEQIKEEDKEPEEKNPEE